VPGDPSFLSHAQNREDVVLWRALGDVPDGRYVEVGANHPTEDSVTRAFYDRGWSGITVEPMHDFAEAHRAERPRDTLVEAVLTAQGGGSVVLHEVPGTGLSTIVDDLGRKLSDGGRTVVDRTVPALTLTEVLEANGGVDREVHFMLVDTEGSEAQVLAGVDLTVFRPWVLVIEATAPNSTEQTHGAWEPQVLAAGYQFCLFDGLSRFYVADEHAERLRDTLSYPACALDTFVDARAYEVWLDREQTLADLRRWRAEALEHWAVMDRVAADASESARRELEAARAEIAALRASTSWRVTRPLRAVSSRLGRA
jgi:FkbM family methyltransferase